MGELIQRDPWLYYRSARQLEVFKKASREGLYVLRLGLRRGSMLEVVRDGLRPKGIEVLSKEHGYLLSRGV